ncbi:hypothetical protein [Rhizobium sullae]|uniref:hypothetical protein n=1 Tax=Rhizobium sullae TaxID=50338 RepID=UPI000B3555CF|nr:hypothetical protein [Rhizobium sullae]
MSDDAEILDLRRKVEHAKSIGISAQRQIAGLRQGNRQGRSPDPATQIIRAMAASLKARVAKQDFTAYVLSNYPEAVAKAVLETAANPNGILKAATSPAQTSVAGWAAELADTTIGPIAFLAPQSAFSQLARRPGTLRLSFTGNAGVTLPATTAGDLAGGFLGEGQSIPVRKGRLVAAAANPSRIGVISTYTREMAKASGESFENLVKSVTASDIQAVVDAVMLSANAAAGATPAGLLYSVAPLPASAETGAAAIAVDLGALAAAIPGAGDLVFLSREEVRVRALVAAPGAALVPWITAPSLAENQIVALDAAALAIGEGDLEYSITEEALIVTEDSEPIAEPLTAETQSLWQVAAFGLRLLTDVSWAMRGTGRICFIEEIGW